MTVPYDPVFGYKISIPPEHARIHAGEGFIAGYFWGEYISTATLVADNASVVLTISPSQAMHTLYDISAGGECEVRRFKGITASTTGASVTVYNKNEYSSKVSGATVQYGSSGLLTTGTEYPGTLLPGGSGGNRVGGQDGGYAREHVISSTDGPYAILVTNRSGGAIPVSINLEWYEPGVSTGT